MRTHATPPSGQERQFAVDEMFFSTTDPRGVIRAGNAVFTRLSGYSREELVGAPHNVIRHPAMPRLVFQTLWHTLQAGRPFAGYVLNQAKNGDHYWVFAVIVPIRSGYVSVRFKPTTALLTWTDRINRELVVLEAAAVDRGAPAAQAAAAGGSRFVAAIHAAGFADYEDFSHQALIREIKARDSLIAQHQLRLFPERLSASSAPAAGGIIRLHQHGLDLYHTLNGLFGLLDAFAIHTTGIRQQAGAVVALAECFRLSALNAHIAAEPLAQDGVTLGTVAGFLNGYATTLGLNVGTLATGIAATTRAVEEAASHVAVARLLLEMTLQFLGEITAGAGSGEEFAARLALLNDIAEATTHALQQVTETFLRLQQHLPQLEQVGEALRKDILSLHVAQISGLIEAARIARADSLRTMFTGFRNDIDGAHQNLRDLVEVVSSLRSLVQTVPASLQSLVGSNHHLHRTLGTLTPRRTVAPLPAPAARGIRSLPPIGATSGALRS